MSTILNTLKKLKRKYKRFKEDERGGDIINNVLILVVTIIIIALLILFAIELIGDIKDGIVNLGNLPSEEDQEGTSQYRPFKIKINSLFHDNLLGDFENLINKIIHPNEYLMKRSNNNFLNFDKSSN